MNIEEEDYLRELQQNNQELQNKVLEYQGHLAGSGFKSQTDNLIEYQLSTDDILEQFKHFLAGDIIKTDEDGNTYYEEPQEEELKIFNNYGVNTILQIISSYYNRVTMLSYYDEDRINEILADFGDQLIKFIYCNYEKMGLTTEFKKSRFELIVLNIVHMVESVYRRALRGKEREEIGTSRNVVQSITPQSNSNVVQRSRLSSFIPRFR